MKRFLKFLAVSVVAVPLCGSLTAHASLQTVGTVEEVNVYAFGTPLQRGR